MRLNQITFLRFLYLNELCAFMTVYWNLDWGFFVVFLPVFYYRVLVLELVCTNYEKKPHSATLATNLVL